jgi:sporulation protein YlmC with PRC-barrel domain
MQSRGRDLLGKVIVSEETGRKFGVIGDINFISESGELLNLVLVEPTKHIADLNLEKDENNRLLVPFSSVKSVGDFVIISEKEIV